MIGVGEAFSTSYTQARAKFLQGAAVAGLKLQSHKHPLLSVDGEDLAMDLAFEGEASSDKLLIVSSACHGVEGYCGSGVQVFALADTEWHERVRERGIAVLYVHALNPHGFSYKRRVTHENVDLNRNFADFSNALPANFAYDGVHDMVLPPDWPPTPANDAQVAAFVAAQGLKALQSAVTGGQHGHVDGLFYGGVAPTWSNQTIRQVLREHGAGKRRIGWIDLHTGLGPSGHGERICATGDDVAALERARNWWGGGGSTPITSPLDGSSTSAKLSGMMALCTPQECPQAEFTSIAMEYGTVPVMEVIDALRGDHWAHRERLNGRAVAPELQTQITQTMWDAFYTQTDTWKGQIISQGRQSMFQAADGLAA